MSTAVRRWRADVSAAGSFVVGCAVLGVPLGWLWQAVSPHTRGYVDVSYVIPEESESQVAADARALVVCLCAGAVLGAGAWSWRARRGAVMAVGTAVAALACAVVMAVVGRWLSGGHSSGAVGTVVTLPTAVHARAVLLVAPILTLAVYLGCALFAARDDLGRAGPAARSDVGWVGE